MFHKVKLKPFATHGRFTLGLLLCVVVCFRAEGADLVSWQQEIPRGEFSARKARATFTFTDYLALEDKLFGQLSNYEVPLAEHPELSHVCRYSKGYQLPKSLHGRNWNRSAERRPTAPLKGGVLLVHGLSDSPYSMHALEDFFVAKGFYVLNLRLPGHGTVPAGLLKIHWHDWERAVRIAARHVQKQIGPEKPFLIAGFSTGAALAVNYATQVVLGSGDPKPEKLFLFSPAIGITPLGRLANWHKPYSWIPAFEKSKWLDLQPEFDPFKYNSFPKNAGAQIFALSRHVQSTMKRLNKTQKNTELPPIFTFQSIIDSTIIASDIIEHLYMNLPANGSHIYIFDVNHTAGIDGFFERNSYAAIQKFESRADLNFYVTVLTNDGDDAALVMHRKDPLSSTVRMEQAKVAWPAGIFSLSHVAITVAPDDPLYGSKRPSRKEFPALHLGTLAPRGDYSIVNISAAQILRLRYNPFFDWMTHEISGQLP